MTFDRSPRPLNPGAAARPWTQSAATVDRSAPRSFDATYSGRPTADAYLGADQNGRVLLVAKVFDDRLKCDAVAEHRPAPEWGGRGTIKCAMKFPLAYDATVRFPFTYCSWLHARVSTAWRQDERGRASARMIDSWSLDVDSPGAWEVLLRLRPGVGRRRRMHARQTAETEFYGRCFYTTARRLTRVSAAHDICDLSELACCDRHNSRAAQNEVVFSVHYIDVRRLKTQWKRERSDVISQCVVCAEIFVDRWELHTCIADIKWRNVRLRKWIAHWRRQMAYIHALCIHCWKVGQSEISRWPDNIKQMFSNSSFYCWEHFSAWLWLDLLRTYWLTVTSRVDSTPPWTHFLGRDLIRCDRTSCINQPSDRMRVTPVSLFRNVFTDHTLIGNTPGIVCHLNNGIL